MPAWSMGKAKRSDTTEKKQEIGPGAYGSPDERKVKRASPSWTISGAKRNTVNKSMLVPGPGAYDIKSIRTSPLIGIKGKTTVDKPPNIFVPGPGQYHPHLAAIEKPIAQSFSFTGRPKSINSSKRRLIPGPGNYDIGTTKSTQASRFGTAKRADLDNGEAKKVPGPGAYNANEAANKLLSGPRFGFGSSKRGNLDKECINVPGPGSYAQEARVGKEGKKFSILGRQKSVENSGECPGPGAYNPLPSKDTVGRGFRMCPATYNHSPSQKNEAQVPGPGQYDMASKYAALKFHSPSWRIGSEKREDPSRFEGRRNNPGPGSYVNKSFVGEGPKIGIKPRLKNDLLPTLHYPGPGAYNPSHKVIEEGSPSIGLGYGKRSNDVPKEMMSIPGPGAYTNVGLRRDGPMFGFGSSKRSEQKPNAFPGPGNYQQQSSVGELPQYERSKCHPKQTLPL